MSSVVLKCLSLVALAATFVPGILYLMGFMELEPVKTIGLVGTIVWFVVTPLWMGRQLEVDADQVQI